MYYFEVKYDGGRWALSGARAFRTPHTEPTRERIEAFVEGLMALRAGKVVFYRPDGGVEREAVYESHDLELWGRGF